MSCQRTVPMAKNASYNIWPQLTSSGAGCGLCSPARYRSGQGAAAPDGWHCSAAVGADRSIRSRWCANRCTLCSRCPGGKAADACDAAVSGRDGACFAGCHSTPRAAAHQPGFLGFACRRVGSLFPRRLCVSHLSVTTLPSKLQQLPCAFGVCLAIVCSDALALRLVLDVLSFPRDQAIISGPCGMSHQVIFAY